MTDQLFSEIDAVNVMLLSAGQSLVNSLASDGATDTSVAEFLLNQQVLDHQLRGLAAGIERRTLTADVSGEYDLPDNCIDIQCVTYVTSSENGGRANIMNRNGKLYNSSDGTYVFSEETLIVEVTVKLEWAEIPVAMRKAIASAAAVDYVAQVTDDTKLLQRAMQHEAMTRAQGKGQDVRARGHNQNFGSTAFRASYGRQLRGSNNPRYPRF